MNDIYIRKLLKQVKNGNVSVDDAYEQLKEMPFKDMGFASIDNHRALRTGFPEVVFCQGKTPGQIGCIMSELVKNGGNIMNIKPLFDRVVVESVQSEEKTKSGFILPSSAQEKPQTARVVAVGPGGVVDGKDVTMEVKIGDVVLYAKYSGSEFKVDGKEFTILRQSDILAIVE